MVYSDGDDFAANLEQAAALPPAAPRAAPSEALARVATPGTKTIDEAVPLLGVAATRTLKLLLVAGRESGIVALALRGDHELNAVKAQKLPAVASPLRMATPEEI